MERIRPNPDELLKQVNQLEKNDKKGKLKIFFGYAAGVGKTYAMLDAAHLALKQGIDVVVGYVEPHTRPETLQLLDGLERLPTLEIKHKGITLHEFDLDGALSRHPQLILVDELAHTNATDCRHQKRYMDIEELLNAGIDVYTTVNVQHLESLNDIIASITGVFVRERIPDYIFKDATQVKLVDIEPNDLIDRLTCGKVYNKYQAKRALSNFFAIENLVALREISLRTIADRVTKEVASIKHDYSVDGYGGEHILVCLSSSPTNPKVIRTAARMAEAFCGKLTAIYVKSSYSMSDENKKRILEHIKLAEELGAITVMIDGDDIAVQIAEYAKLSHVTKIILGKTPQVSVFRKLSLIDKLIRLAPNLDVYVIPDSEAQKKPMLRWQKKQRLTKKDILKSLFIFSLVTAIGFVFEYLHFRESNIIMVFILGVLLISMQTTSRVYGIVSAIMSVLLFNFFFTDPRYTFKAYGADYPITFAVMLATALMTSTLTTTIKKQGRIAARTSHNNQIMLETSLLLQKARSKEQIMDQTNRQLVKLLNRSVVMYWGERDVLSKPKTLSHIEGKHLDLSYTNQSEEAVANWVYKNNKTAGATTNTLPRSPMMYFPVSDSERALAVIGVLLQDDDVIEPLQLTLLHSILNQVSFVIKQYLLDQEQRETIVAVERDEVKIKLLTAITHDLVVPVQKIMDDASQLSENPDIKKGQAIYEQSIALMELVQTLNVMTNIKQGRIDLDLAPVSLATIIHHYLSYFNEKHPERTVSLKLPIGGLMVNGDEKMLRQVLANILDNTIKYTESSSVIELEASEVKNQIKIEIKDFGSGISEEDKPHIFEMFYIGNQKNQGKQSGLGLALCKTIITSHRGKIYVKDNHPHGTIIGFVIPKLK